MWNKSKKINIVITNKEMLLNIVDYDYIEFKVNLYTLKQMEVNRTIYYKYLITVDVE